MFETEREKLKDQNAIDDYCREYFLRTGKYLENPSPEEILNLVKDYKYFEFAEKELNMSENILCGNTKQLESFFHLEKLFFEEGRDVTFTRSIRYFQMVEHSHDYFEIECVLNGSAMHSSKNETIALSQGDMVLIPPKTRHNLVVLGDGTVVNIGIRQSTFQSAFWDVLNGNLSLSKYFQTTLYGVQNNEIFFRSGLDDFAEELLLMIYRQQDKQTLEAKKLSNHLMQALLYYVIENCSQDSVFQISEYLHEQALAIKLYMIEHYQDVTLDSLASHFSFSAPYLSRLIKRFFGINYAHLVQSIRLEKARELLINTNMHITDISAYIGYESNSYFINIFKQAYGTTPSRYRKAH